MNRTNRIKAELLDRSLSDRWTGAADSTGFPDLSQQESVELENLVQIAHQIHDTLKPEGPAEGYIQRTETRLLKKGMSKTVSRPGNTRLIPVWRARAIPVFLSLSLVVGFLAASVGVVSASAGSLPGDRLYPIKLGVEDIRLAVSLSIEADTRLLSEFSDERVRELEGLAVASRLEDIPAGVEQYLATLETLLSLETQLESDGLYDAATELDLHISRQVETLHRVQGQVPLQAQAALQRAIDRSQAPDEAKLEKNQEREQLQVDPRATQTVRVQEREDEKNLRTAEQLARKYDLASEQVLSLFQGTCQKDWNCVREAYREQFK